MNIFLALDPVCLSAIRLMTNRLGGTERFFFLLKKYLIKQGHKVTFNPLLANNELYDVAIHSNVKNPDVTAKRHVCRAGSYHTDAEIEKYDLIITLSYYFANYINKFNLKVIPVCYNSNLRKYITNSYTPQTIISSANPNRYFKHFQQIKSKLDISSTKFNWIFCGGNKLYTRFFPETFKIDSKLKQKYLGILPQEKLFKNLATAHLYCYPNFSDNSETFCVSVVEAAAIGLPVILPNRKPFTEILPDNPYFYKTTDDMVMALEVLLQEKRENLYKCNTEKYTEDLVLPEFEKTIMSLL